MTCGDVYATKRDCVDSSPLPFPPKRNRLDDDADFEAEMASLMRPLNPTESVSSDEDEGGGAASLHNGYHLILNTGNTLISKERRNLYKLR